MSNSRLPVQVESVGDPSTLGLAPLTKVGQRRKIMVGWLNAALLLIATNAVLIQTVIPEESPIKNAVRGLVILGTLVFLFVQRSIVPVWMMTLAVVSIVLLLLAGNTDQFTVVFVLLFIPAMWSVPERDLDRAAVRASVFALLLVFAFLALGLTTDELRISSTYLSAEIRTRYTFGTAGVSFLMNLVYGAAAFVIYYAFRWGLRRKVLLSLLAFGGAFWVFTRTDGRGGMAALVLFIGLALTMKFLTRGPVRLAVLSLQPLIYLGFAFWLSTQRENATLNQFFSFRPMLYAEFMESVTFWDALTSTTVKQSAEVTTLDNSVLHLLFGGGILIFVVFCIMFGRAVMNLASRGMHLQLAFLTAAMAYGALESILLRVENIFILYAWYLILRYCMKAPFRATSAVDA